MNSRDTSGELIPRIEQRRIRIRQRRRALQQVKRAAPAIAAALLNRLSDIAGLRGVREVAMART